MKIKRVRLGDPEVVPLLTDLAREYDERYGDGDSVHDVSADAFAPPSGVFLVLLDGGVTVAGGGIRRLSETTGEVKRMWTNPAYRRQGHAVALLAALEEVAQQLGYRRLRLETGHAQPEALALYRRLGYREIGNYGIYENATGFERTFAVPEGLP
ncbi:GNAT family N-acetyltransferase [Cryobacterium sinapicolor]|uniref:GNAT family N-acetyltransferase n=1 Tax=Cryobacterium sinapicolor TaxID=1259236 RepID=UPI00141BE152|nr:GNAT family N-acetyltransferase [Cryobacterium sinapicolor]